MNRMSEEMIAYLRREILIDPDMQIDEDTPLVSSGLVDSFSLVEVLSRLEKITRRRIPNGKVSPQDLETVRGMLETAEKVGKPLGR